MRKSEKRKSGRKPSSKTKIRVKPINKSHVQNKTNDFVKNRSVQNNII